MQQTTEKLLYIPYIQYDLHLKFTINLHVLRMYCENYTREIKKLHTQFDLCQVLTKILLPNRNNNKKRNKMSDKKNRLLNSLRPKQHGSLELNTVCVANQTTTDAPKLKSNSHICVCHTAPTEQPDSFLRFNVVCYIFFCSIVVV